MKICRFCHNASISLLYSANRQEKDQKTELFACTNCGFGSHGPIIKCGHCGLIYVDEKISQSQISTYYEVAQDPLYFAEQSAREKTFKRYLSCLGKKGKLLDIGTNTGLFVRLALDAGWEAIGLEPNKWAAKYAIKNYNVKLINKPFEKNIFPQNNFDVITMWDVIEHFTDPVEEMKKIYDYLKPDGVFAFTTVDPVSPLAKIMGNKWSWYMEMHKVFFSQATAKFYLEKIGFKKITFKPHSRYLSLGYLSTRLAALSPRLSAVCHLLTAKLGLSKVIVPYCANDLYDCYAFK